MAEHDSFRVPGGARSIDERTAVPRGLIRHSLFELVLDSFVNFKVGEVFERFNFILIVGVVAQIIVFRYDDNFPVMLRGSGELTLV